MDLQLAGGGGGHRGAAGGGLDEHPGPDPGVRDGLRADAGDLAVLEETRVSTVAVVVASVVAAVVLFVIDTLSYKLMVEWMPAMWGKL